MGLFDSVMLPCPDCGIRNEFQSKGGACELETYDETNAPADVMTDINRHSPVKCTQCGTLYHAKVSFSYLIETVRST